MSNKLRVYISHSIRGAKGADATHEDMAANNRKAIAFVTDLKARFQDEVEFYCPGEHDEFVLVGYELGILSETQILAVDCKIIESRDMILAWAPDQHISNGMMIEVIDASMNGKQVVVVKDKLDAEAVIDAALERKLR